MFLKYIKTLTTEKLKRHTLIIYNNFALMIKILTFNCLTNLSIGLVFSFAQKFIYALITSADVALDPKYKHIIYFKIIVFNK